MLLGIQNEFFEFKMGCFTRYSPIVRYAWIIVQLLGQLKDAQLIYSSFFSAGELLKWRNTDVASQTKIIAGLFITYEEFKGQS